MKCVIAKNNDFVCPALNSDDECTVYADEGVLARERRNSCNYKEIRKPAAETTRKKIRIGQQKQVKRKVKSGNIEE